MIDIELIGAPAFAVSVGDGGFTYSAINHRLSDVIAVAGEDFVDKTPETLLPADFAEVVLRQYRLCVAERRAVDFEGFYDAPGGGRWWQTTVSPVFDGEEGAVVALIGVAVDITARKDAERHAREIDARLALAIDLLDGGFWHYAIAPRRFTTSPQLSRLVTGTETAIVDDEDFATYVLPEDHGSLDFGPLMRGEVESVTEQYRIRTATGDLRWMSCQRRLTRDTEGRPENIVGVVMDITEQKRRQELLAAEAATDSLTGLMNRRGFEAMGQRLVADACARGGGFGLLLLDLDRFKPVNDTHGHPVGDAVLREVAARLRRHTRPGDAAVRLGGDEFAVLIVGDVDEAALGSLAQRLVDSVSRPIVTAAASLRVGASIGVARWSSSADRDLAGLIDRADAALFAVKHDGRGAWRLAG